MAGTWTRDVRIRANFFYLFFRNEEICNVRRLNRMYEGKGGKI